MDEVFTDAYILGKIHSRGFMAKLEEIIEDDREDLKTIGLKRNQPGGKISYEELMTIYPEAKKEVDEFFGVENISDPTVISNKFKFIYTNYLGLYLRESRKRSPTIIMCTLQRNYVKPILIHEYTHHLSSKISMDTNNERILYEGLSMAIEHELAGQINKNKCTTATVAFVLNNSIRFLNYLFAHLDHFFDPLPKKRYSSIETDCTFYSGYPLLRIAKKKFGPEILRDVLFRRSEKLMDAFES